MYWPFGARNTPESLASTSAVPVGVPLARANSRLVAGVPGSRSSVSSYASRVALSAVVIARTVAVSLFAALIAHSATSEIGPRVAIVRVCPFVSVKRSTDRLESGPAPCGRVKLDSSMSAPFSVFDATSEPPIVPVRMSLAADVVVAQIAALDGVVLDLAAVDRAGGDAIRDASHGDEQRDQRDDHGRRRSPPEDAGHVKPPEVFAPGVPRLGASCRLGRTAVNACGLPSVRGCLRRPGGVSRTSEQGEALVAEVALVRAQLAAVEPPGHPPRDGSPRGVRALADPGQRAGGAARGAAGGGGGHAVRAQRVAHRARRRRGSGSAPGSFSTSA